jgi:hypothetical protein
VLADGCLDADPQVHQVLLDKVFPRQAEITSVAEWAASLRRGQAWSPASGGRSEGTPQSAGVGGKLRPSRQNGGQSQSLRLKTT